jgi:hypothetical protein
VIPYRLIAYLGGAAVVLGALFWLTHAIYAAGDKAGAARIQVAWDQDKAEIAKLTAEAIAKTTAERDTALQANEVIHGEYVQQLASVTADSAQFAHRLRDAAVSLAAHRSALQQASDLAGSAAASAAKVTDQLGQLVGLVTDLRAECIQNDDALDALVAEINRQL